MYIKVLREFLFFHLFLVFWECAAISLPEKIFLKSFRQLASPHSGHRSNVTSVKKASLLLQQKQLSLSCHITLYYFKYPKSLLSSLLSPNPSETIKPRRAEILSVSWPVFQPMGAHAWKVVGSVHDATMLHSFC